MVFLQRPFRGYLHSGILVFKLYLMSIPLFAVVLNSWIDLPTKSEISTPRILMISQHYKSYILKSTPHPHAHRSNRKKSKTRCFYSFTPNMTCISVFMLRNILPLGYATGKCDFGHFCLTFSCSYIQKTLKLMFYFLVTNWRLCYTF